VPHATGTSSLDGLGAAPALGPFLLRVLAGRGGGAGRERVK
jgi:hypothetical protein